MNLFYQPLIADGVLHLDEEESRHCVKVLRKRTGDIIHVVDGAGTMYECRIENDSHTRALFSIESAKSESKKPFSVHISIAPTKNADRIEWFVEKATEFGIDTISLVDTDRTERSFLKTERLQKVAISAMKQSLKATLPLILPLQAFEKVVNNCTEESKFIAYVDQGNPVHLFHAATPGMSYIVLIGPEGDFSPAELQLANEQGFIKVSLGHSRLRTETAGLAACHTLNLINAW